MLAAAFANRVIFELCFVNIHRADPEQHEYLKKIVKLVQIGSLLADVGWFQMCGFLSKEAVKNLLKDFKSLTKELSKNIGVLTESFDIGDIYF